MKNILFVLAALAPIYCFSQWNGIYFHADQESQIEVVNEDTIIAVTDWDGRIHSSTDGGETWSFFQTEFTTSWFLDVHFPTNSVGYACGGTAFGTHRNIVVKTTDGGQTWESVTSNDFVGYNFQKIHFMDANTGFVAQDAEDLLITTDGGENFNNISTQGAVTEITSKPNEELFIGLRNNIGPDNYEFSILKSTDLGNSWETVYTDTMNAVTGINHREINKIFFVDNNTGYAVGGNGLFLKTTDGGTTWSTSFINPNSNLTGLHFVSPDEGYINNAGGIYRTEDGGMNWTVQNISPLTIIRDIQFANDNVGFALGDEGIYQTSNGGAMGVDEVDDSTRLSIYPNPASDKIFIQSSDGSINSVVIYNQLGQRIKDFVAAEELDISSFSKGIYFVVVKTDQYEITEKIVKE